MRKSAHGSEIWVLAIRAIIHMVFGILVVSWLILMYAASAFICHVILLKELTMMRYEMSEKEETERSARAVPMY